MKTGFGLDRFGKPPFGWTDFYVPFIVENIPEFYLVDDNDIEIKESDFKKFLLIFEDVFNDIFYKLDLTNRICSFLWKDDYIGYFVGEVSGVFNIGDKWIRVNENVFNEISRIGLNNGIFIKFEDDFNIYMLFRCIKAGFGTECFGTDDFGCIIGGSYVYLIPGLKNKFGSGFGFDLFGNSKFGYESGYKIKIMRYDLYNYLFNDYGLKSDKYNDVDFRFSALIDNLFRNDSRGHNSSYEISSLVYGFLISIYEVYRLFNFSFFQNIDKLNDSNPYLYLFNDFDFRDYYSNFYKDISGEYYLIQRKKEIYPEMLHFDDFECDPISTNRFQAENYPSLDIFGWMVNTENPRNYINGVPNNINPITYKDDFNYYNWSYISRYYSKYAGLIVDLYQQYGVIPDELSMFITDSVIKFLLDVKPIHIRFLKFILNLLNSRMNISVNLLSYSGVNLTDSYLDVLAHYDNTQADDYGVGNDNFTDNRPKFESTNE